jgi:hypothetical protein
VFLGVIGEVWRMRAWRRLLTLLIVASRLNPRRSLRRSARWRRHGAQETAAQNNAALADLAKIDVRALASITELKLHDDLVAEAQVMHQVTAVHVIQPIGQASLSTYPVPMSTQTRSENQDSVVAVELVHFQGAVSGSYCTSADKKKPLSR